MTSRALTARVVGIAAACLVLPLAACEDVSGPSPASGSPGLERYYGQQIAWEACADYATTAFDSAVFGLTPGLQCARIEVPLDYREPEGATLQIAVLRSRARGERVGSLVINPGGPGGSGLFAGAASAAALAKSRLTESFDLVGFDPRGVGSSVPAVDCVSDAEADRDEVPLGSQGTTVRLTEAYTEALVERCAKGSGGAEVLAHLGSRDVARDLDVLRGVLREDNLTFLGQSYGTRLGTLYAEQFPQNVRAMLLDGAVDPRLGTLERRVGAYAGFQAAFERMAAFCAKQDDCPLGADPDQATDAFSRLVRPLREKPVPALGHQLDFDAAVGGVIAGLYDQAAWPRIIKGLSQIRRGRGDELRQISWDFSLRDPEGKWTNFAEANYAINCMDEQRLTEAEGGLLRTRTYADAPFMDPGVDVTRGARDSCEHWPAQPSLTIPYAEGIEGLPPTLVVSITGDPTTPHTGGIALANTLGSRLLTVRGEGHTVVLGGQNHCVDEIASAYLIDLRLPADGATCPA